MTQVLEKVTYTTAGYYELAPQVKRWWLVDKRVIVYAIGSIRREAIAAWADDLLAAAAQWPLDQPVLVLGIIQMTQPVLTPYWRTRLLEIFQLKQPQGAHIALVANRSPFVDLVEFLMQKTSQQEPDHHRIFVDQAEALQWLQQWGQVLTPAG